MNLEKRERVFEPFRAYYDQLRYGMASTTLFKRAWRGPRDCTQDVRWLIVEEGYR
jgi:hypothetical protein